jgi:Predicted glycosyltransferases
MSGSRVLIVVPTLGKRPELLGQCLDSMRQQEVPLDIVLVGPTDSEVLQHAARRFDAELCEDPGGLAAAINLGVASYEGDAHFVNWLGDDDLLEPGSLTTTIAALDAHPEAVLAYGACRYIDDDGRELWISKAGSWAPRILTWGPDLIPQPGMLMRRWAWEAVGGLDESFRFAFDLDLLLKLKTLGGFVDVDRIVSSFRWHSSSLTVSDRSQSLYESEVARRRALSPTARSLAWLWEKPVRGATRVAAWEVSRRAAKKGAR